MNQSPLSVSELNREVRQLLENSLMRVLVTGEVSNFSAPSSGHWYFSLKDQQAQVRCAMFRNRNQRLIKKPANGDEIVVAARVSLYEGRGEYQLIVEDIEHSGEGALRRAYELLRLKLQSEGLFDHSRKKPIPLLPRRIGIITSPTGAAIRDMLTVLGRRFPAIPILLIPVPVQGAEAAPAIAGALEVANRLALCDLLIVGRGGGSLEDLWAFNEEAVVRAIAGSRIPVISAVGHETDTTLSDFAADLRAPTPSAAAEKASPDQVEWMQRLDALERRLQTRTLATLAQARNNHATLRARLPAFDRLARQPQERLTDLAIRLRGQIQRSLADAKRRHETLLGRLKHPGTHLTECETQRRALEERLHATGNQLLPPRQREAQQLQERLRRAGRLIALQARRDFESVLRALNNVSPLATLSRGYAIVTTEEGAVLERSEQVNAGDRVEARLGQGSLVCEVLESRPDNL